MIAALILAAGGSRRMQGRDKLMETIDGTSLLRRQTLRALATGCEVLIALPPAPHPRHTAIQGLDVTIVPVKDAAEGMNASLRAGIATLPTSADGVMVILADMPDITTDDLNTVLQAIDTETDYKIWRATTQAGDAGHPIVFDRTVFPQILELTGDNGAHIVAKQYRDQTLLIPLPTDHARVDLDTPQEWEAWRATNRST